MIRSTILVMVLWAAAACGKDEKAKPAEGGGGATPEKTAEQLAIEKENAAPVPPKEPAKPTSDNDVDLTFSGAFSATLKGKAGTCGLNKSGPMPGATWQVRSEELGAKPPFELVIISEESSFDDPSMVVNVKGEGRTSYARKRGGKDAKLVVARDATSAELDVELKEVVGKGTLHVVGTIKCSAPLVSP